MYEFETIPPNDYFEIDPLEGITVPWPSILDTEYLRDSKMVAFMLRFP